jgi:hypothetical protein
MGSPVIVLLLDHEFVADQRLYEVIVAVRAADRAGRVRHAGPLA